MSTRTIPAATRQARRALGAAAMLGASLALAQTPNPSFALVGHIERFSLDAPAQPLGSAVMTVRGISVILPRNLLVTMPGQYLTPQDLFRGPAAGAVQGSSGLALEDPAPPRVPFEAELQGNIVGNQYIAGVARITQGALHVGSGFVQAIDGASGELRVGAQGGASGARVRLNDPKGIYGQANGAGAKAALPLDQRFSLDPDNSPVHARTGFPVCVARAAGDARAIRLIGAMAVLMRRSRLIQSSSVSPTLAISGIDEIVRGIAE